MSDLKKKNFLRDAQHLLEEIITLYEECDFEVNDYDDEDGAREQELLVQFISHINDAMEIAQQY